MDNYLNYLSLIVRLSPLGQNAIVIVKGANLSLGEADIAAAESIIMSCKVLLCQLEISPQVSLAAMKCARKHNGKNYFVGIMLHHFALIPVSYSIIMCFEQWLPSSILLQPWQS